MPKLDEVDFGFHLMPGEELHEVLRGYRERGPVQPTHFLGIPSFIITEYDALLDAFMDVERFPPHLMYRASLEPAIGKTFISVPDPEHQLFRKLVTPAFRSRAVASYEKEGLAALGHELVDTLEGRAEAELVSEFAARFPYLVISRLLGLPREREDEFHAWALAIFSFRENPERARRAEKEMTAYLKPVVEARRREPRNDVISELVQVEVEGRGLTDEEIDAHVRLLFPTGGETTHGSLGNLLYALFTQGNSWERVRENPEVIPAAVDEALRWETSIAVLPRLSCSEPIQFHGVDIPADSWVLFAMAGANRDPDHFRLPDHFDIDRESKTGLTFGRGVKSCPGMHLARRNMQVAVEVLAARTPNLRLLDAEAARPRKSVLRCPEALRVALR